MPRMTPIMEGNRIVGGVVERLLRNEYGTVFGREYVVYAAPTHRHQALMEGVVASLRMKGIEPNTNNLWNQTLIYWGANA